MKEVSNMNDTVLNKKICDTTNTKDDYEHISLKGVNPKEAILQTGKEAPFITFPPLSELSFITHGFSTKLGGVSTGNFKSMNLGYTRGDKKEDVDKNYEIISRSIGFSHKDIVTTDQVHETVIRVVGDVDKGKGIIRPRDYSGVDGLITNCANVPLITYYADCVPLYFVDVNNHAIGLSHSGWRGTVKKMAKKTFEAMNKNYQTTAKDLVVVIGPSICKDCYEVSQDVYDEFNKVFTSSQISKIFDKKNNNKFQLDLWEANRQILLDMNVGEEQIHISRVCTCCNHDIMFSHRAHGNERGSLSAFLMLSK